MADHQILVTTSLTFGLLLIAAVVSMVTRRLRFPYSVALTLVGFGVGLLARLSSTDSGVLAAIRQFQPTPELILFIFLPTLVFESAYNLPVRQVARNLVPILTLAIPGLVLSTAIVGGLLSVALGLPLLHAALFGALISATDPVAVIALFKELGAPKRLVTLVEGESLFNDATAIVVFKLLLALVLGSVGSVGGAALTFLYVFVGGSVFGAVLGVVFAKLIEKVRNDALVESTLTIVLAYQAFILADHYLHVSGVMATVAAGMVMASYGRTKISPQAFEFMHSFWEYMAYVANAIIFLLVGIYLPRILGSRPPAGLIGPVLLAVAVAFVARAVVVFGLVPLLRAVRLGEPVDRRFQWVVFWGGLRGAIALALALSLLETPGFDRRLGEFILILTAGVVLFTLTVNGLTMGALVRWFGLDRETPAESALRNESMLDVHAQVQRAMTELRSDCTFSPRVVDRLIEQSRVQAAALCQERSDLSMADEDRLTLHWIEAFGVEKNAYLRRFAEGNLSEAATRDLGHRVDVRADRVRRGWGGEAQIRGWAARDLLLRAARRLGLRPIVHRLEIQRVAEQYESARGRYLAARDVVAELRRRSDAGVLSPSQDDPLIDEFQRAEQRAEDEMADVADQFPEYVSRVQELVGTRIGLNVERAGYDHLRELGVLTDQVHGRLRLDVERRFQELQRRPIEDLDLHPTKLLAAVPACRGLTEEDLAAIAPLLRPRSCLKGEVLFREGDLGDAMYLIGRGVVKVWRGRGPDAMPLATLHAGSFVGEMALLHPAPRTASAMTATVASLLVLRKPDLEALVVRYPSIGEAFERAYRERKQALEGAG